MPSLYQKLLNHRSTPTLSSRKGYTTSMDQKTSIQHTTTSIIQFTNPYILQFQCWFESHCRWLLSKNHYHLIAVQTLWKLPSSIIQFKIINRHWNQIQLNRIQSFSCTLGMQTHLLLWAHQIAIPSTLQRNILETTHSEQKGITRTKALLREKVWWPGITQQIKSLTANCHACQIIVNHYSWVKF